MQSIEQAASLRYRANKDRAEYHARLVAYRAAMAARDEDAINETSAACDAAAREAAAAENATLGIRVVAYAL